MKANGFSVVRAQVVGRCLCGSTIVINGTLEQCEYWLVDFWADHNGEGHGPATASQQRAAKRKRAKARATSDSPTLPPIGHPVSEHSGCADQPTDGKERA